MERLVLELNEIQVSFLDKIILDIKNLRIHQFDRIGIVGNNGSGKSTLLRVMSGDSKPDCGNVSRHIEFGYFRQKEAPEAKKRADYRMMSQLHVPDHEYELSGGEQTRLKLAQLLSDYYEGLLIDEPTNHLDAEGINFLVEELRYYYGALVMVSHDRYVLDQLVTKIWEVHDGQITEYTGNYSDYKQQKELERQQQQELYERYVKEKQRLMLAADEKMKKASKITQAKQKGAHKEAHANANRMYMTKQKDTSQKAVQKAAKSLEKRMEKLEEISPVETDKTIHFPQAESLRLHNRFPIMADQLTLKSGEKVLLENVSFQFPLGETIAIKGLNGSGKSTLLRHIVCYGKGLTISPKVKFGVYEQLSYQTDENKTVLAFMNENSELEEPQIRAILHEMNFTGNDLIKKVSLLSGGEMIRLKLCQLFAGAYNVLVLDEPTNFLDMSSIRALENFLHFYEGTVLLVSHDREFVKRVADSEYEINKRDFKKIK